MVQVYIDTTPKTQKASAISPYSVHALVLAFTKDLRRFQTDYGYTFERLPPVWTINDEQEENEKMVKIKSKIEPLLVLLYDAIPVRMEQSCKAYETVIITAWLHANNSSWYERFFASWMFDERASEVMKAPLISVFVLPWYFRGNRHMRRDAWGNRVPRQFVYWKPNTRFYSVKLE